MHRPWAVVDLDGVVADVRHRLRHLERRPRDWDAFFAGIPDDPALPEGLAVVASLAADHDVVFLSGRPERTRVATVTWLSRHDLPHARLVLRGDRDRRPARVFKRQRVRALAAERPVAVVVDDDPQVCASLESAGWQVLRADWMARAGGLDDAQERLGRT